ncbi:MAG: hypothetical protein IT410_04205 [Candidatus Doudnabacteria bacterium]|nr:hypothetical protein [Candidatus Doudnabacteria bacterium]
MIQWIKQFFTIKPRSLEEFMSILQREDCTYVNAVADRRLATWRERWIFGVAGSIRIGNWEDYNLYGSRARDGRPIIYKESFGVSFYSLSGYADAEKRGKLTMKCMITAWARLSLIKQCIPTITCNYVAGGVSMDEVTKWRLFEEAHEHGIEPFPL